MYRLIPMKCRLNHHHVFKKQQIVRQSTVAVTNQTTDTARNVKKIVRPKKIDRSPTDLLYTLSATVGRDPTAKHYKFHDDPFLTPPRHTARELFALAQESGKRTAQWIRDKYGDLFNSDEAVPQIEAFLPKSIITEATEVSLDHLKDAIDSFNATDAEMIYKLLQSKNIEIPLEMQESLLALVSFYNHQNPIPFDMFEERLTQANAERKQHKGGSNEFTIQWRDNCFANILFNKMEPTPAAYNIMIYAMYKYGAYDKALALFEEAKQNQIALDLATYNSYLRHLSHAGPIKTIEQRWETVKSTLREMNDLRIKPNVHTLNAILASIRSAGNYTKMPEYAASALAEFQRLNIEPSLETYWHILCTFYIDKSQTSPQILDDILVRLEQNPVIKAQSVDDLQFFPKAMNLCRFRLTDGSQSAYRLDALVTHGDNIKFLGPSNTEQGYYRDFLITILNNKPLSQFFEVYDQLVPDIYSLEPNVVGSILSILDSLGEIKYVPKIWADIMASGVAKRSQDAVLKIMCENQPLDDDPNANDLNKQFADIAWRLYEMAIYDDVRNDAVLVHAAQLSQTIIILCRINRFENVCSLVERILNQKKGRVIGVLTKESVESFVDASIANKTAQLAIKLLGYSVEMGIGNSVQCARKLVQSLELEPRELKQITDLVGHDTLTN